MKWIYLSIGGVAGTLCRFVLSSFVQERAGQGFPYGTLAVNLIGCFIIGFISADNRWNLAPETKLFLAAGFCGAFTTFSAFMLETSDLLKNGQTLYAFAYVLLSVAAGFVALWLGSAAARAMQGA